MSSRKNTLNVYIRCVRGLMAECEIKAWDISEIVTSDESDFFRD